MNAPFYFSKMMEEALGHLRNKILLFYLDVILVIARDWPERVSRLRSVFQALIRAGLTLKLAKCHFHMSKVEFLGFVISASGIELVPNKARAISEFMRPKNAHGVQ